MAAKIFRINYKSDFILTLNSDAGWMTPFCIKFWTGAPSQAFFVGWDGTTYTHCSYDPSEPTKLLVQFDDHHLPIGELKYQVAYHFTVADFPNDTEDEVINPANITTEIDGETYQVMLDFTGETAPEIEFSLPAYANEAQRIANEEERIAHEQQRINDEQQRIANEETRQAHEQQRINDEQQRIANEETRQAHEAQRIAQETTRVNEFATLKSQSQAATSAANTAAALANEKAQLAADKAALADAAATLANAKAQLAADKAALADDAATLANDKAALAQQKAEYAQQQGGYAKDQGDYAKNQGDYAKEQGDTALADHQRAEADHGIAVDDHTRAESDHGTAVDDHTQAGNDHTRAESDHGIAVDDHTQAGNDHTRAESDHTRAESDHAAVEVFVDSLGVFDLSKYNAVGGVLATYADLSAALTALNALDSKYKYGGMSFKFVHTSDNIYVQYRLMTHTWSPIVGNWQEVVDSQIKVKLQGVTAEETKVVLIKNTNWYDGKFVKNDGTIQDSTAIGDSNGVLIINVSGYKKVRFLGFIATSSTTVGYGFSANAIDPTSSAVQLVATAYRSDGAVASALEYVVDVPAGMNYFACTIKKSGTSQTAVMTINDFYCYVQNGNPAASTFKTGEFIGDFGVDSEPTDDNKKFVRSSGVYKKTQLLPDVSISIPDNGDAVGYYDNNLNIVSSATAYRVYHISDISGLQGKIVKMKAGDAASGYCYFCHIKLSNNSVVHLHNNDDLILRKQDNYYLVDIPNNASELYLTWCKTGVDKITPLFAYNFDENFLYKETIYSIIFENGSDVGLIKDVSIYAIKVYGDIDPSTINSINLSYLGVDNGSVTCYFSKNDKTNQSNIIAIWSAVTSNVDDGVQWITCNPYNDSGITIKVLINLTELKAKQQVVTTRLRLAKEYYTIYNDLEKKITDSTSDKATKSAVAEINLSLLKTTYYTSLQDAINAIPAPYNSQTGIIITFATSNTFKNWQTWKHTTGSGFTNPANWERIDSPVSLVFEVDYDNVLSQIPIYDIEVFGDTSSFNSLNVTYIGLDSSNFVTLYVSKNNSTTTSNLLCLFSAKLVNFEKTGIDWIELNEYNNSGVRVNVLVDCDKLKSVSQIITSKLRVRKDYLSLKKDISLPFKNKVCVTFGDSITEYDGETYTSGKAAGQVVVGYQSYLKDKGMVIINRGYGGADLPFILNNRVLNYNGFANCDYMTITSGANDTRHGVPVGTVLEIGSTYDTTTFCGAMQAALDYALSQNPHLKICMMTPIKGWIFAPDGFDPAQQDDAMVNEYYADAIKAIGRKYSIPVLDWYNLAGFNILTREILMNDYEPDDPDHPNNLYILHPSAEGYKRMADLLIPFMASL